MLQEEKADVIQERKSCPISLRAILSCLQVEVLEDSLQPLQSSTFAAIHLLELATDYKFQLAVVGIDRNLRSFITTLGL